MISRANGRYIEDWSYYDEVNVEIDDDINVCGNVNIDQAQEINLGIGENLDNSVNGGCNISCGGRRGCKSCVRGS